jgi:hypothetical protein
VLVVVRFPRGAQACGGDPQMGGRVK